MEPFEFRNFWVVSLLFFFLSFGLVCSQPDNKTAQFLGIQPVAKNASQPILQIFGGSSVSVGEFPFMASVLLNGNPHCGGTLISSKVILTAAHCLYGWHHSQFTVVVNSLHVKGENDPNARIRGITKMFLHDNYNTKTLQHDIAVMRLDSPIDDVKPVMLPFFWDSWQNYEQERHLDIVGWGRTRLEAGSEAPYLLKSKVDAVKMSTCRRQWSSFSPFGIVIGSSGIYEKEMMCAARTYTGVCNGDSGGPLLVAWWPMQIGITSWGPRKCDDRDYSQVYTRITNYLPWIADYARAISDP